MDAAGVGVGAEAWVLAAEGGVALASADVAWVV